MLVLLLLLGWGLRLWSLLRLNHVLLLLLGRLLLLLRVDHSGLGGLVLLLLVRRRLRVLLRDWR